MSASLAEQKVLLERLRKLGSKLRPSDLKARRAGQAVVVWYDFEGSDDDIIPIRRARALLIRRGKLQDHGANSVMLHLCKVVNMDGTVKVGTKNVYKKSKHHKVVYCTTQSQGTEPVDDFFDALAITGKCAPHLENPEHTRAIEAAVEALEYMETELGVNVYGDPKLKAPQFLVAEPGADETLRLRRPPLRPRVAPAIISNDKAPAEAKAETKPADKAQLDLSKIVPANHVASPFEEKMLRYCSFNEWDVPEICSSVRGTATYDPAEDAVSVVLEGSAEDSWTRSRRDAAEMLEKKIKTVFGDKLFIQLYSTIASGTPQLVPAGKTIFSPFAHARKWRISDFDKLNYDTLRILYYLAVLSGRALMGNFWMYDNTNVISKSGDLWVNFGNLKSKIQLLLDRPQSLALRAPGIEIDVLNTTKRNMVYENRLKPEDKTDNLSARPAPRPSKATSPADVAERARLDTAAKLAEDQKKFALAEGADPAICVVGTTAQVVSEQREFALRQDMDTPENAAQPVPAAESEQPVTVGGEGADEMPAPLPEPIGALPVSGYAGVFFTGE